MIMLCKLSILALSVHASPSTGSTLQLRGMKAASELKNEFSSESMQSLKRGVSSVLSLFCTQMLNSFERCMHIDDVPPKHILSWLAQATNGTSTSPKRQDIGAPTHWYTPAV